MSLDPSTRRAVRGGSSKKMGPEGMTKKREAANRDAWRRRVKELRDALNLAREFQKAGVPYAEADAKGRVFIRTPAKKKAGQPTQKKGKRKAKAPARGTKKTKASLLYPAGPAMLRAAKRAREVARRFGTPIYFIRNGKIVAEKP